MIQLMQNKNVEQYDPVKRAYKNVLNPKLDLELKILTGDKGDNVPAVRKKVGIKTAEKILKEGLSDFLKIPEYNKNYKRNKQLIDLTNIPENISNKIKTTIESYDVKPYNGMIAWQFLMKNKLNKLSNELQQFSTHLKVLK